MPKLNDTQSVLLAAAAQRESGSLLPFPENVTRGAPLTKALSALVLAGLGEERDTSDLGTVHRTEDDRRIGLFITAAGLKAIGIEDGPRTAGQMAASAQPSTAPRGTKAMLVLALLNRPEGATVAELTEATGWLPHTTRAALTGLRKKGYMIERSKRGEDTCYTIPALTA